MTKEELVELIELVIEQIKKDIEAEDVTALEELLLSVSQDRLIAYLPEEENQEIDLDGGLSAINE